MKKAVFGMAVLALMAVSCEKEQGDSNFSEVQEIQVDMSDFYVYTDETDDLTSKSAGEKNCGTMKILNAQLRSNPGLEQRMYNIEKNARKFIASKKPNNPGGGNGGNGGGGDGGGVDPIDDGLGIINIPVYVHVLYNTNTENISNTQIQSQIAVLNEDFSRTNSDANLVPSLFESSATNAEIQFELIAIDRKQSSVTDWGTNDAMKSSSQGGIDPITPDTHLNIWVVNKMTSGGRTILGYAQFPGGSLATDGVVVGYNFFGDAGTLSAPFNGGRTGTHEVGHWLNLRHIWGDGRCNRDDFVVDTPKSDRSNYGCPAFPTAHCRSTDMTMNYMDYTDDACMYMYTEGQKQRMRAIFAPGGARSSFIN